MRGEAPPGASLKFEGDKGMQLGVFERVLLLNILPREGDFRTLKVLRKLMDDLGFTEEESAALAFQQDGTQVKWRQEADTPKEVPIGEIAHGLIADRFRELDRQKKLTIEHMGLYERFVLDEGTGQ